MYSLNGPFCHLQLAKINLGSPRFVRFPSPNWSGHPIRPWHGWSVCLFVCFLLRMDLGQWLFRCHCRHFRELCQLFPRERFGATKRQIGNDAGAGERREFKTKISIGDDRRYRMIDQMLLKMFSKICDFYTYKNCSNSKNSEEILKQSIKNGDNNWNKEKNIFYLILKNCFE